MTAIFDPAWRTRLVEGDTEAALQLARSVLRPLYVHCQDQLADARATQQLVRQTLLRAVREIRDYQPESCGDDIWNWILTLAAAELKGAASSHATPREATVETDVASDAGTAPDAQFIYRLEADLCVEVRRSRAAANEEERQVRHPARERNVSIACPECSRVYQISPSRVGRRMRCGHCGKTFAAESEHSLDEQPPAGRWYLKRGDEAVGPHTASELREMISTGQIRPTDLVRKEGEPDWRTALSAEGLLLPPVVAPPDRSDVYVSVVAPPLPSEPPRQEQRAARQLPGRIARFEIRQLLGSGSFGNVYRAYDPVLERELAIKVATSAALSNERARPLVLQEPKAAAKLRHPNIVAVHDAGFDGPLFYIAIDLIHGCTLRERLQQGSVAHDTAVGLVLSLAQALDYAHHSQVLHRDVKPSNIMIDTDGQALLMDFGLARIEYSAGEQAQAEKGFLGTPGYMPPEQISREYGEIGPHSDQYSLGVVLYELLCGRPPFVGPEGVLVANTLHIAAPALREHDALIDRDLQAICLKTLAKNPGDRYESCQAFADDLRRYQEGRPTLARPLRLSERVVRWARRERKLSAAVGSSAALLLLLLVTLAVNAVVLKGFNWKLSDVNRKLSDTNTELEKSVKAESDLRVEAQQARRDAEQSQQQAERNLATTYFRHGHTLCDNGQVPAGLAYLAESLVLAERAAALDPESTALTSAIRLSLATWRHQLHDLQAILPHETDDQHHQVQRVVVDRKGRVAITVSRTEDGTWIWCWDLTSDAPQLRQDPIKTAEKVEAIALADNGQSMVSVGASAEFGSVIRIWRPAWRSDRQVARWEPGDPWLIDAHAQYRAIAIAPDGRTVVAAGRNGGDGIARAWSLDTRDEVCTYYEGPSIPQCVAYSQDGRYLAIGTDDSGKGLASLQVYRVGGDTPFWGYEVEGAVYDVTFSRNGFWLAAATGTTLKGEVRVFSAGTGQPAGSPLIHLSEVKAVEFSPNSQFMLTGSLDRTARLWHVSTGRLLGHPLWHDQEVLDVAFVSSGADDAGVSSSLLTVSDNLAQLWNIGMDTPRAAQRAGPTVMAGARIAAEVEEENDRRGGVLEQPSERIAIAGTSGLVGKTRVFEASLSPADELKGLQEVRVFRHDQAATCVAAGAQWGVVGLQNGRVLRVNWDTGDEQVLSEFHSGSATCAAVSRDDIYAATAGEDGLILVWKLETGEIERLIHHPTAGHIRALAFDPLKTNKMLIAGADGSVTFWDGESGESLGNPLSHPALVSCAAYDQDGLTLAVGLVGGGQLWCRSSEEDAWVPGARLEGESETLRIAVWEQRQLVATGDLQGNVRFWHTATGEPIGPPLANQGMVTVLIGSQQDVLSGTSSGEIRRWPLPQSTVDLSDQLQIWSKAATGVTLSAQQSVDRLSAADWLDAKRQLDKTGRLQIDKLNERLRQRYGQPVPRLQRKPGESTEQRAMLQTTLQTTVSEHPQFDPPTVEYLDRYLPSDTEALIGLDWRQVVAAPLVWLVSMSHRNLLFEMIQWKELMDICGVHPLLDIDYVLLAAPRHSISPDVLKGRNWPGITVLLRAEFDAERLRALVRLAAESVPDVLHIEERPDGERILVYRDNTLTVYIAVVEGDGGTLVGSPDRTVVDRALDMHPANRLDPEFRSCLQNTNRNRSLWFVAHSALLHPDLPAYLQYLYGDMVDGLAFPEQIQGGATVFTHWEYDAHAMYRDALSLQGTMNSPHILVHAALWLAGQMPKELQAKLREGFPTPSVEVVAEGAELVIRGNSQMAKMQPQANGTGWAPTKPGGAKPAGPPPAPRRPQND